MPCDEEGKCVEIMLDNPARTGGIEGKEATYVAMM